MYTTDDTTWLSGIYDAYYDLLYDMGRRLLRGQPALQDSLYDILQEVFLALWRKRDVLATHENIGGWLVNALRLEIRASLRKLLRHSKREAFSLDDAEKPSQAAEAEAAMPQGDMLEPLFYKEKEEALCKLLGQENARLFIEYTVNGYSAVELSEMYGISEGSIRMRVNRAKKKILEHPQIFSACLLAALCFRGQ